MLLLPFPDERATAVTETETVSLSSGQRAVVSFTPTRSSTVFWIGSVAVSKYPDSSYIVKVDNNQIYGPSDFPPTDVDDLNVVWSPALEMNEELTVVIEDLRTSGGGRSYHVQPIGYEIPQGAI